MASPTKKRKFNNYALSQNRASFGTAAKLKFRAADCVSSTVAKFLKYAARMRKTSPEMMLAAILPTTAACIGPKGSLKTNSFGDLCIPSLKK